MATNIPKQAQRQAEIGEALEEALQTQQPVEQDPVVEEASDEQDPTLEAGDQLEDSSNTPTNDGEPETDPQDPPQTDLEKLEHKYSTLQGMLKKEQTKSRETIGALTEENSTMAARLDALEAAPVENVETEQATTDPLVTDQDVDDYGADMVDLIKRAATEVVQSSLNGQFKALEDKIETMATQIGGVSDTQNVTAEQTYFAELAKVVPDYPQINESPEFLAWLDDIDPLSGLQRQAYLNNAFANRNIKQTTELFKAYKAAMGIAETPDPTPTPDPVPSLERQLQPEGSSASDVPVSTDAKIYTPAEIEKFYLDVSKKVYQNRDEDRLRIESAIDAAIQEGRVRFDAA